MWKFYLFMACCMTHFLIFFLLKWLVFLKTWLHLKGIHFPEFSGGKKEDTSMVAKWSKIVFVLSQTCGLFFFLLSFTCSSISAGPAYVYLSKLIISSLFFYSEQSLILEGHTSLFMLSETGLFLHWISYCVLSSLQPLQWGMRPKTFIWDEVTSSEQHGTLCFSELKRLKKVSET